MLISINEKKTFQMFESFGASGAWWAQSVGKWDSEDTDSGMLSKDRIIQLLYNKEKGIGLRTYRYNLGSGSATSGKGEYSDPDRRAQSFLDDNGNLDFTRDEEAVYMMRQAVKEGADEVIFFVNSPPEIMTKNGMGHLGKKQIMRENLSPGNYERFASYCLDCCKHFMNEGIPVKYLSPVNEPFWIWNGGQEGCHYSPKSVRKVLKVFADMMDDTDGIDGLLLSGAENGDIRWFNKSYTRNLLKEKSVRNKLDSVDVHSYCLHFPIPFVNNRTAYLKRFRKYMDRHYKDVPVKMSEWCHMNGGRDTGMESALVTANTIFEDISILNVTSWQHWLACSRYDYCDGLIYVYNDSETFEITKRYYVTGNFSKYIPYQSTRIDVKCDDSEVNTLAFKKDEKTVLVLINNSDNAKSFVTQNDCIVSVTDKDYSLEERKVNSCEKIEITPKSVTTIVWNGES